MSKTAPAIKEKAEPLPPPWNLREIINNRILKFCLLIVSGVMLDVLGGTKAFFYSYFCVSLACLTFRCIRDIEKPTPLWTANIGICIYLASIAIGVLGMCGYISCFLNNDQCAFFYVNSTNTTIVKLLGKSNPTDLSVIWWPTLLAAIGDWVFLKTYKSG